MSRAIWLLVVALAATIAAPGPGAGAPAAAPVAIPDTPAGRRARAVLESLAGDRAVREALVRGSFTARALEEMPAAEWSALLDRIAAQSGGLDPVAISLDSSDDFLVMDARARRADRFARFYLAVATRTDPGKIADLGIFRIRDPAKVAADAWPPDRLAPAAIVEAIDMRARRLAQEDLLSGVVLVAKHGTPVYSKAFGQAEKSFRVPNATDTRFHLASAGKMFTAVAIGQLADARTLSLDDTLARWVPEFPNRETASSRGRGSATATAATSCSARSSNAPRAWRSRSTCAFASSSRPE